MKVLVSLGTQKQQFTRILRLIENSDELKCAEILVQAGHTKYKSDRMNIIEFMNQEGFNIALNDADIVICHGGVGTIFSALKSAASILGQKLSVPTSSSNLAFCIIFIGCSLTCEKISVMLFFLHVSSIS